MSSSRVDVSIVMGVYNGANELRATMDSVLAQRDCDLEFIVVDDGSTDASGAILDEYARGDARVRVIHQSNSGLTPALVRGCEEARGEFIARQDCGDISLPGRFRHQLEFLRGHPDVVLTACAARFVAPAGEQLFVHRRLGNELHDGLGQLDVRTFQGPPHHGSTMFRSSAYRDAGGYRPAFFVAQDVDLWLRLWERGRCVGSDEIGYEARMDANGISAQRRAEQMRLLATAMASAKRRRTGLDDGDLLANLGPRVAAAKPRRRPRLERARFFYFIGSCLRDTNPVASRRYYWKSFSEHPLMIKSLLRMGWW